MNLDELYSQTHKSSKTEKQTLKNIYENKDTDFLDKLVGAASAFEKGGTYGFGTKLGGLINALGSSTVAGIMGDDMSDAFEKGYNEIVQGAKEKEKEFEKTNPALSSVATITGSLASPLNYVGGKYVSGAKTFPKIVGRSGIEGAVSSALETLGNAENIQDIKDNLGRNVAVGTAFGVGLPIAFQTGKKAVKEGLGFLTGSGSGAIEQAYGAGKRGSKAFIKNLRDSDSVDDAVDTALNKLYTERGTQLSKYAKEMGKLKENMTPLKYDDIIDTLSDLEKSKITKTGINTMSKEQKKVFDDTLDLISEYAKKNPKPTLEDLDALKQSINKINVPVGDRYAKKMRTELYNSVKNQIEDKFPAYKKIMKNYAETEKLFEDVKNTFSISPFKQPNKETALRKLQSVFRNNVNTNYGARENLLNKIDKDNSIRDMISGQFFNSIFPRGLRSPLIVGGTATQLGMTPSSLALLLASSPRLVGETTYGLGKVAKKTGLSKILEGQGGETAPYLTNLLVKSLKGE